MNRRDFLKMITVGCCGGPMSLCGSQPAAASEAIPWSYAGQQGPAHWSELSPTYQLCRVGQQQSPIDLTVIAPGPVDWQIDYRPSPLTVTNTGHTVRVDYAPGSVLTLDGQPFELRQFHFHHPSEHTQDHQHQRME
ncbi:MAG: carbonic anhydrase family protein, partial [Cyanobacteria bacterium P01_A01_bin.105]